MIKIRVLFFYDFRHQKGYFTEKTFTFVFLIFFRNNKKHNNEYGLV
jgi:hypothetical protein